MIGLINDPGGDLKSDDIDQALDQLGNNNNNLAPDEMFVSYTHN